MKCWHCNAEWDIYTRDHGNGEWVCLSCWQQMVRETPKDPDDEENDDNQTKEEAAR